MMDATRIDCDKLQVEATPDGSFEFRAPYVSSYPVANLSAAKALELCGWIIGKAAQQAADVIAAELAKPPAATCRRGCWTLKVHGINCPSAYRSPESLMSFIAGLGIRYAAARLAPGGSAVIFEGCYSVPVALPAWIVAEEDNG